MALFTSIVDLESIQVPSSDFKPELYATEIEALARKILHLEASIHIPVVRSRGIDEYELVSEHLSYYAYLKARELNSELPDRLMVFIMNAKNEADILGQLEVTAKIQQASKGDAARGKAISPSPDLRLENLEDRVTQTAEQMDKAIAQLKSELLAAIDTKLPTPIPALDAFNRIGETAIAHDAINKMAFLGSKKAQKIIQKLQEFKEKQPGQEFRSFAEVLEALKGTSLLSAGKMLEVIDRWNT
jgi:hypothetical protein